MITVHDSEGKVLHKSRNLRGINEYARTHRAVNIILTRLAPDKTEFFVGWEGGDWAATCFGSFNLCEQYAKTKRFNSAPILVI